MGTDVLNWNIAKGTTDLRVECSYQSGCQLPVLNWIPLDLLVVGTSVLNWIALDWVLVGSSDQFQQSGIKKIGQSFSDHFGFLFMYTFNRFM